MQGEPGDDAEGEQGAEAILGAHPGADAAIDQDGEDGEHDHRAEHAGFLADDGEDAVGVGGGDVEELLPRRAESDAGESAGTEGRDEVDDLETGFLGDLFGVEEGADALHAVASDGDDAEEHRRAADHQHEHVAHGRAGEEEHDHAGAGDGGEGSEIGFEHQQSADHADDHAEGGETEGDALDLVALGGEPGGDVDADGEFGELGGLERGQRADLNPARGSVLFVSDAGDQDRGEQQERDPDDGRGEALPDPVVDTGEEDEGGEADARSDQLADGEVAGVAVQFLGDREGG